MPVPRLISTDFDGTLHADHEDPPVPVDLQDWLRRLQARGALWCINTGRDLGSLMEGLARARLSVKPDYVVVVEREIYRLDTLRYAADEAWNRRCRNRHAELFARVEPDLPRLTDLVKRRGKVTVYGDSFSPLCLISSTNAEMDAVQRDLELYCREVPGLTVVRNDVYARFSHAEFNKGTALAEIARQHGITPAETFAAGDHWNDLPMLDGTAATLVAAPANAIDPVKETVTLQGGYVSHQPWGHGVARALEYYIGEEPV